MAIDGLDKLIDDGEALARDGQEDAAIAYFQRLTAKHPDEPRLAFALGGAFDSAGRAAEAMTPYLRARQLGLSGDDVPRWYVQVGSTLRNLGQTAAAVDLLTEGMAHFPDDAAIRMFQALALFSDGRGGDALAAMLDLIIKHSGVIDVRHYERSIRSYADGLRGRRGE